MVVIGNKVDMKKDRAVSKEEGKALADEFGAQFLEVSVSFPHLPISSNCCSSLVLLPRGHDAPFRRPFGNIRC